ncbi:MAG: molybdopterin molybdotransferase MoeA [Planctomycetes bacterium]|nr:molybdopterin molybdotransferase MoeA [Planctomycetota bacterium]
MISVDEALQHVSRCSQPIPSASIPIVAALGLRLAEAVVSSVDSPPFDKSMLDGFAVEASDRSPTRRVIEQVVAGEVPHHAVEPGNTIQVMTGAPLPEGADAVVKVEDVKHLDEVTLEMPSAGVASGTGILRRGAAFHRGQQLLAAEHRLTPVDIGLLAEIGQAKVCVAPRPRVAVLATGNELVEIGQPVGAGQIGNSNGPMLMALLESVHASSIDLGIGRDDPGELKRLISAGLEADMLIVTGGVSAGVLDLVPGVLQELGVEQIFHKIRMKPGKPLWFGQRERTLVFGLPGNPVSTLVSFEIFVKPALRALGGEDFSSPPPLRGELTGSVTHRGKRPTYHPCWIDFGRIDFEKCQQGLPSVELMRWSGSADLAALTRANALAVLPEGDYELAAGAEVNVVALHSGDFLLK